MQPLPYKYSESLKEIQAELEKRQIPFTITIVKHEKGRCKGEYVPRIEHVVYGEYTPKTCVSHVKHGAYVLAYATPNNSVAQTDIDIATFIKTVKDKEEIMVEEPGRLAMSVRTVTRGRNCTYCKKEINRGDNYIRRVVHRREINICRDCAEKELTKIMNELSKKSDMTPNNIHIKNVVQRW